jgi:hypothetical protein
VLQPNDPKAPAAKPADIDVQIDDIKRRREVVSGSS